MLFQKQQIFEVYLFLRAKNETVVFFFIFELAVFESSSISPNLDVALVREKLTMFQSMFSARKKIVYSLQCPFWTFLN